MAWTELLPSGKYRGVFRNARGEKRSAGTFTHKAAALRAAAAEEVDVRRRLHRSGDEHRKTWESWVDDWWPTRDVEGSTLATDEGRLRNYLRPKWSGVPVGAITRNDVKAWAVELRRTGMQPETVKRCVSLFSASLAAAIDEGIIDNNPASRLRLKPGEQEVERFLTRDEFDAIVAELPTWRDRFIAEFLVNTGVRWGEFAGLHEHRLLLPKSQVRVVEAYDTKEDAIKGYTKARKKRGLPLLPGLVEGLERITADEADASGTCRVRHSVGRCRSPLVFVGSRGGVMRNNNWASRVWTPAVEAAGVGHVRIHDLRHTFASWLLQGGHPLAEVSMLLGHESMATTERYAHLVPNANDEGVVTTLGQRDSVTLAPRLPHEEPVTSLRSRRPRRSDAVGPVGLEPTTSGLKARSAASGGNGGDRV